MKNNLHNDICLYCLALSGQSTSDVIVVLGSAAIVGLAGLFAPTPLNR